MKDVTRISRLIGKKTELERNLPAYSSKMMHMYNQFSLIKFSLNYYTVCEVIAENEDEENFILEIYNRINEIVKDGIISYDVSKSQELVANALGIRDDIIKHMEVITSYVDKYQIFEYILNRVENRFGECEFDDEYYNGRFTNDIMHYIINDKDSVNARISEIIAQLPIRITKSKFFERISDACSLYKGGQKSSFDEFLYMIRTVSMLYEPEGFESDYPELFEVYNDLMNLDYKNINQEEYSIAANKLQIAVEKVLKYSDLFVMLQELVNDLIIIMLSNPYNMTTDSRLSSLPKLISEIYDFSVDKNKEINLDFLTEVFTGVEGVQEEIYELISSNDYVIDEYNNQDILNSLALDKQFNVLKMITKLSSNSIFIKLDEEAQDEDVDEQYIDGEVGKLTKEFEVLFEKVSTNVKRAVMANVIATLPNFFRNTEELQIYINTSLSQCNDVAEKTACVNLIKQIINDNV